MNNEQLIDRLTKIIEDSDDRMRITNDMVNKLSSTLDKITQEYTKHIDRLQKSRDKGIDLILAQQKTIEQLTIDLREERNQCKDIIDKILLRPNLQMHQS